MWPVLGLFFLAPFVGEFLLGNIPITDMGLGLLLAPLYGSGAVGIALVPRWSRRAGWDQRHRFALAAGAVLTYVWCSFPVQPELGGTEAGDYVFSGMALLLLLWCILKLRAERAVQSVA